MYNINMTKPEINTLEELNTFCKKYKYYMELEIPFQEMEGFVLRVSDEEESVMSIPFVGIDNLYKAAASLLGKLAKEH